MLALLLLPFALAEEGDGNPWTLTPVAQVRPRLEIDTGRDGTAETSGWFVSQRSRLGVHAQAPRWQGKVVLQDVRMWGGESDTLKDYVGDAIDMHEAWVRWTPNDQVSLTVGRQEINIHEQRLVGAVDWTQQGRVFDAVRYQGKQGSLSADVAAVMLVDGVSSGLVGTDGTTDEVDAYALLARGGWKQGKKDNGSVVDLVSVTELNRLTEQTRETVGLYAAGGTGSLSGRVEGYFQMGSVGDVDIQSYMLGLQGTLALGDKTKLTLWFDNLSGDEDLTNSTITAFQAPFATGHKFYGTMDVMCFSTACWVDGRGLRDAALKADFVPVGKVKANLDLHAFLEAADQDDGRDGAMIGQELDLWLSGPVAKKGVTLAGGLSFLNRSADELVALDPDDVAPDMWMWMALDMSL